MKVLDDGAQRTLKFKAIAPPDEPPRNEQVLSGRHLLNGAEVANINPAVCAGR